MVKRFNLRSPTSQVESSGPVSHKLIGGMMTWVLE